MTLMIRNSSTLSELEQLPLKEITTEELKILLSRTMAVTAQYITFIAHVWHELESRGVDLSSLRSGLTRYLPLIHGGKLDPSVIIKFAGQQVLLRELALMSIEEQLRLAGGEKLPLVTQNATGEFSAKMVDVSSLHVRYYSQLFNMGHIRTEEEQKSLLTLPSRRKSRKVKVRKKKVSFNAEKEAFTCGQMNILAEDILEALSTVSGRDKDDLRSYLKLDIKGA